MPWTAICEGAGKHRNEDLIAVHEHDGVTDILVIDGATSLSECDYIDTEEGDVAWFARQFAAELHKILSPNATQDALVKQAIDATRAAWLVHAEKTEIPHYARPIAALSWTRIFHHAEPDELHLYSLGDCKTLLRSADGAICDLDPWINPQEGVLQREISAMQAKGVSDPAERRALLTPLLRRRREEQNTALAPSILCLYPQGPFTARKSVLRIEPGTTLLSMTDGFYRLSDPYELYSPAQLVEACVTRGLDAMLSELRTAEAASATKGGLTVKAADDAAAVLWMSDSVA
ncbi:protein phosphatase 2C domain-containing protein [Massilia sp. YIM B04103]|uniref:protein phosphatase 2C domain-containing protein n=1 Tax=Massilia sp. YIM B04103 TaxID=2963106 RepID=UPI00210E4610|nr:protein phosphatase 2C domain-containing protein [Massilia sp. YIM B04103]